MKKAGKRQNTTVHNYPLHHHRHTHKLLYIITILLAIIILAIVLNNQSINKVPTKNLETQATLTIDSATCEWDETQYKICESISWNAEAGSYVKPYIPGGELLDEVQKQYSKQFNYCQHVGTESGYRIVRAMLYDKQGLLKDMGKGVSCEAKKITTQKTNTKRTYNYKDSLQFIATLDSTNIRNTDPWYAKLNKKPNQKITVSRRSYAQGYYIETFPDSVQSCTITGTWVTDNDHLGRQRRYCHEAKGTFVGYADAENQYVTNDPTYFPWEGESKPKVNPLPKDYPNYAFYMNTCNTNYYTEQKYYFRGTIEGFGTKELTFNWEYFDDETRPQVSITINLDCTLIKS
tara:strand:+ start:19863 stop:20903 length:1041 start_codon:yes stop_codon:yes gene_type:complete